MTVAVAAGQVAVAGTAAIVAGGNLTIAAADGTQDRVDAIVANSSGVKSVLTGPINDGLNAQPPDTTGYVLLAYVYVISQASANYTGTIVNAVINTGVAVAVTTTGGVSVMNLFNGTTSYTPAAGVSALQIEAIGGGGGSGGVPSSGTDSSAGGGGAGGSWSSTYSATNVAGAHTVAIGAGGIAGIAGGSSSANGGTGGASTFRDTAGTIICQAVGGLGGFHGVDPAGIYPFITAVGGNASDPGIGDLAAGTNAGGCGIAYSGTIGISGAGGAGPFGGNAIVRVNGNSIGGYGEVYGGGAAGALTVSAGASLAGAAGAPGVINVKEYS
jgi:hypothetical protein